MSLICIYISLPDSSEHRPSVLQVYQLIDQLLTLVGGESTQSLNKKSQIQQINLLTP